MTEQEKNSITPSADSKVELRNNINDVSGHSLKSRDSSGTHHNSRGAHHHSRSGHSHHHSHHRHHSSSKKRKKQSSKGKEKFISFIRRNKHYLIYAAMAIIFVICLLLVGGHLDKKDEVIDNVPPESENSNVDTTVEQIQINVPLFSEEVVIVGPAIDAYLKAESSVSAVDIYDLYNGRNARLDIGLPVKLSYKISGVPKGYIVKNVEFVVADNAGYNNPYIVSTSGYEAAIDVYNLKTGTQYYYSIDITFFNGVESSVSGKFKTAPGPRAMYIDGVYNMRDIGGWVTEDGKEIKQGLLYRGCEIDGAVETKYTITPEGVTAMLRLLGIKTDMDLRLPEDNKYGIDALGPSVKHTYYSAPMYSTIFNSQENAEKIRIIFSDLADESNYPIYLHCTYGQDRTGTVCYLLEALLGLSEEDLMKEYQLSALHHGYQPSEYMDEFVNNLKSLPGDTMSEKVEGYLLSIGVTEAEIASIRSIFLEK